MIDLSKLGTITSNFGRRDAPTKGASTYHKGLDIVLASDKIPAISNGRVKSKGYNSSEGNYVTYATPDGADITYMHMASSSPLSVGQVVVEGEQIGTQGKTGIATGKHVHVSVKQDGKYINPLTYMSGGTSSFNLQNPFSSDIPATLLTVDLMLFVGFLAFQFFMRFIESTKIIKIVKG